MNVYTLSEEKLSPYCSGKWDNKINKFLNVNSTEVINCCMESCKGHIQFCFDECSKNRNFLQNDMCNKQCYQLIDNCESGCMEIQSDGLKIVSDCADYNGCGKFPLFNIQCLENNKNIIVDCCKKSCIVNQSMDCDNDFCDDFYSYIAGKKEFPLRRSNISESSLFHEDNKLNFGMYAFIIILFIIGFYIVYTLSTKK